MNTNRSVAPEYAIAFKSARAAKSACLLAIFVALAAQLTGMFMIRFVGVLDSQEAVAAVDARKTAIAVELLRARSLMNSGLELSPTTMPAEVVKHTPTTMPSSNVAPDIDTSEEAIAKATMWREYLTWTMDAAKALAPIICVMLVLATLLAVVLSLVGRLGGAAGLTSALLWSMVLLILLTPWQDIFAGRFARGAMYSLSELITQTKTIEPAWGAKGAGLIDRSIYYVRFLGLSILALMVWLTVLIKFCIGQSHMNMPVSVTTINPAPTAPAKPADDYEETQP